MIGICLVVFLNFGKCVVLNVKCIVDMGFEFDLFEYVMISGEVFWVDICD